MKDKKGLLDNLFGGMNDKKGLSNGFGGLSEY